MASFTLTVEDSSPLITYDPAGAWSDSSQDDPLSTSYSGQSYHRTSTQGATATIDFHGTGITIFGGKRTDYGRFAVSVDGNTIIADGSAGSAQNAARQTLATVTGLRPGRHRAILRNLDGLPVDIDSITLADAVGSAGSRMETNVIDNTNPIISYLPSAAAWGQNSLPIFQGGTIHFSQNPSAAASMRFRGNAVAVYGTASPDHADMRITVDGEVAILKGGSNGGVSRLHPQVLLFYRSGLGPGEHTLNLAVDSPNPNAPFIDLDAIAVIAAVEAPAGNPSVPPSSTSATPGSGANAGGSNNGGASNRQGLSTPALAGAIVAGVIGLLACIALCFFALRWRRRRRARGQGIEGGSGEKGGLAVFRSNSPASPALPMQQEPRGGMVISGPLENPAFPFPPRPKPKDSRLSIAPSYYSSPDSGRSHMSMTSNGSAAPLIRPPVARTVPAREFRGQVQGTPRLPTHSPSASSSLSYESGYSRSSPRGVLATPPFPRAPRTLHSPSTSSSLSREWDNPERSPQRPIRRPTHIDFNELQM